MGTAGHAEAEPKTSPEAKRVKQRQTKRPWFSVGIDLTPNKPGHSEDPAGGLPTSSLHGLAPEEAGAEHFSRERLCFFFPTYSPGPAWGAAGSPGALRIGPFSVDRVSAMATLAEAVRLRLEDE